MANAESGPSCRGASRPAASASAAARSPLGTDVKALVDPQPSGPSKRRRSMAPGPDAAAPDTRKRSKKSSQKAPSPTILDISDSDESSEDEAVPPAPRPPPPPPPPPPRARAPAIAAPRRKLAKLGTADPGLRARPAAAYAALLARETLGRPFYPKKMRAHTAASAEKRRIFEGEDCHALALSLSVDDPMFDLPGAPACLAKETHGKAGISWSRREVRFVVHLEARRNPKKISKSDRLAESEACLRMFIAAFPDRPLLGVREKIKPAALPPFYETAAKMERSRGPLRPLSSLSYNKTTRDRLTDEENHLLADLVFNSESITLSSFLVDALILLPGKKIGELEYAWMEALRLFISRRKEGVKVK